jgi:hypothetical protein
MISKYIWSIAYYKYRYPPHFVFCTRAKKNSGMGLQLPQIKYRRKAKPRVKFSQATGM